MHRVEAKAIEVIFLKPIKRVVDEEVADGAAFGAIKVDGVSPRSFVAISEELRCVKMKIIAVGAEVVVDDIQKNHEAPGMRRLNKLLQVFRTSVGTVRREGKHAVV